jgi:hypothetical protein
VIDQANPTNSVLANGSQPICSGTSNSGDPSGIPPTESSGFTLCFRHDPANAQRVSPWASEASKARDGHVSRQVQRLLTRADLDGLDAREKRQGCAYQN